MPRRRRRGVSLVELGLVLVVISLLIRTAVDVSTSYTRKQVTQRAAGAISAVADDVQTYMERSYFDIASDLEARPGRVLEVSWNSLISQNRVSLSAPPVSPDGGTIRLFFTQRGTTIYAVLMSFDGASGSFSPRPDPTVKFAGRVTPNTPTRLNGWDFSLDIPEIAALTGQDLSGNIGVIRYVSRTISVDPYLYRVAVPGRPDLNRMQADLDMGGFDLVNADLIDASRLDVQDALTVGGRIETPQVRVAGDATFRRIQTDVLNSQNISAGNVRVSGEARTGSVVATGSVQANAIVADSATFDALITDFFDGGVVFLETGNFERLNANRIDADRAIVDDIFVGERR